MNDKLIKKLFRETLMIQMASALTTVLSVFVDGAVTGGCFGAKTMAAYGIALPITTVFAGAAYMFSTGNSVLCGNTISSGDKDATNQIFSQCLTATLAAGVILFAATWIAADPLAGLLGAGEELRQETVDYLRGFSIGIPALFLVKLLLPIMQIDSDRGRVLRAVGVITATNIALDLLNGFVLKKGLLVMALATSAGYYAGCAVLLLHFKRKDAMFHLSLKKPHLQNLRHAFSYGFPDALQLFSRSALNICLNWILIREGGTVAVSAFSAIYTASTLCMAFGSGIGDSLILICGVLAGEKDLESIRNLLRISLRTALGLSAMIGVVMIAAAPVIMGLFLGSKQEALQMAAVGLRLYSLCLVFYGVNVVWRAYFQAMRMPRISYPYVLMNNLVSIALAALALGHIWGVKGVWLSFLVGEAFTFLFFALPGLLRNRKGPLLDRMARFSPDMTAGIAAICTWSCSSIEEAVNTSVSIHEFCRKEGASPRIAYLLSLVTEEMCVNICQFGFADGKAHSTDIRALRLDDGWLLRIRDDCALFDPVRYMQLHNHTDPVDHIGIRMVKNLASRMEYVSALKLNNLLIEIKS